MGVDITMSIVKGTEYLYKDIFDGRDSEWFQCLRRCHYLYESFPILSGIPEVAPQDWIDSYNAENHEFYYGHSFISTKDFCAWFEKIHPDTDAGWVTTREKWEYETRGIEPEIRYSLDKDDVIEDMHFIEVVYKYDSSRWLYNYIIEKDIVAEDILIIYKFDC